VYRGDRGRDLLAEKRRYLASGSVMTEAAIDAGLFRDLYVAMGEPVGTEGAWAIRLHYKPMVRWMWLGATAMGIGGLLTVTDRRYRHACASAAPRYAGQRMPSRLKLFLPLALFARWRCCSSAACPWTRASCPRP
jgi:cytochrome c biogenesis factor